MSDAVIAADSPDKVTVTVTSRYLPAHRYTEEKKKMTSTYNPESTGALPCEN